MSMDAVKAAAIVRKVIHSLRPSGWWYRGKDRVGHKVNVHYGDGGYAATVNYETYPWVTYELLDKINDKLDEAQLGIEAEYMSSYEIGLMHLWDKQ
jgi:hypothetical protein